MSATLQGVDARTYLSRWLDAVVGMYIADINALPDDKWNHNFGGVARPASDLTADALSLLVWTNEALKGNFLADNEQEGYKKLQAVCATKSDSISALQAAATDFAGAISNASDEDLNKVITTPFCMEMPLFMVAQVAVSHIWYHDGQLNYKQALLGDEKVHWMG